MEFSNLKVKSLECAVKFIPRQKSWVSGNSTHIIGVQLTGSARHDFSYKSFTITGGCIYFLNQKDKYRVNVNERGEAFSVHFTTYEDIDTDSFCIETSSISKVIGSLEKIKKALDIQSGGDVKALCEFYKMCICFEEIRRTEYVKKDKRMLRAREYMDLHFKDADCLEASAEISQISRRRFNELFKRQFDVTPNTYILQRKVELAKRMLKLDELSVTDIAELCGFCDVYYFSKVFKKEIGTTPSAYRKSRI